MLCTSLADRMCVRALEQHCEIIDVSVEHARAGITNCLLLRERFCATRLLSSSAKKARPTQSRKPRSSASSNICSRFGLTLRVFCMSEFYKSGALLSCLVMHIKQTTDGA